ncbi:MAG: hypothetical protein WAO90_12165 [Mycobacterium sp.]
MRSAFPLDDRTLDKSDYPLQDRHFRVSTPSYVDIPRKIRVKRHADADQRSMNAWIEGVHDAEDMRRRCGEHGQWMADHPEAVAFSEAWADRNLDELDGR